MELSNINTGRIFEALFFSFIVCNLAALFFTRLAKKIGLIDRPLSEPHKKHSRFVPLSGGPSLFFTLILSVCIFHKNLSPQLLGLLFSASIIFAFALWDDFDNLNWKVKLAGQIVSTIVLITSGTRTHLFDAAFFASFLTNDLRMILDIALTLFWVVFLTNAYNLVDSTDGLMLGLSSWALGFFILATLDAGQPELSLLCSLMLGCCIALVFFNSYPAFLFMGDSGAQTIGFLLAAIAIIYTPAERLQGNTWFLPILLMGIPIFDTTLVIISRWRKGQHFYHSGVDHTFHRLVQMGFSKIQASLLMQSVCFALNTAAFFAISKSVKEANIIFGSIVFIGILGIFFFENVKLWKIIKLPPNDLTKDMY